jgi:hypothetical protein
VLPKTPVGVAGVPGAVGAAVAWQIITQFAGQGFAIFAEVRGITNAQIDDCLNMLRAQRDKLPELERELGWAD